MKKIVLLLLVVGLAYGIEQLQLFDNGSEVQRSPPRSALAPAPTETRWRAGSQVRGSGVITRTLADDNEGSRHQRFILELDSGRTVLIAHNIDLAPRVSSLSPGDSVSFYGVYESNDRGGVIHWTHKDPQGRHIDGWLEHKGRRYQ